MLLIKAGYKKYCKLIQDFDLSIFSWVLFFNSFEYDFKLNMDLSIIAFPFEQNLEIFCKFLHSLIILTLTYIFKEILYLCTLLKG